MSILAKIKVFFGFGKKVEALKIPTLLEQFESQYKTLPETKQLEFLDSTIAQLEVESEGYLAQNLGHVVDADDYFAKAVEHFELEVALYKLKHKMLPGVVDKDFEKLLGRLPKIAECFAKPGSEVLKNVDEYIQKFEEQLLLAEADGVYNIKISENGKWICFPFLDAKIVKHIRVTEAKKVLVDLFVDAKDMSLLELDTRVPWLPISFVEVQEKCKLGRVSLLRDSSTGKYYGYIYD